MWLSDRDLCHGMERAVVASRDTGFAVLNLMSDNPGMRWDIDMTRDVLGYEPQDGCATVMSLPVRFHDFAAKAVFRISHKLSELDL